MDSSAASSQLLKYSGRAVSLPAKTPRDMSHVSTSASSRGSSPVRQAVTKAVSRRRGREFIREQLRFEYR